MRYVNFETLDFVKARILNVFSVMTRSDPSWLIGVFPVTKEFEDMDPQPDLVVRFDIGDFPIAVCTSSEELRDVIRDRDYEDMMFLLIWPDYDDHRIRDKSIGFFVREHRVRSARVLTRPFSARR